MRLTSALLGIFVALAPLTGACAGEVLREGTTLVFTGSVMPGDEVQFQRRAGEGPVARVSFHSPGGSIGVA